MRSQTPSRPAEALRSQTPSRSAIEGFPMRSLQLIALAVSLVLAQAAGAADKKAPTIKDLQSKPVQVKKDTQVLRRLYWEAGISEYWLVDARKEEPRFELLRRGSRGYTAARTQEGWLRSAVFGRSFRLTHEPDRLGHPRYRVEIRS